MTRSQHRGSILVLEGDTDARVFKRFIEKSACKIVPAHGKNNALKILEILGSGSFPGLLIIVDADFGRAEGKTIESENLFLTDTHDLETLILKNSDCLERHLDEFADQSILDSSKVPVLKWLLECASPVGYVRWICHKNGRGDFSFKKLRFEPFVVGYPMEPNIEEMFAAIKGQCFSGESDEEVDLEFLKSELKKLMSETYDQWQICNGHDMMKVLAIGFQKSFGKRKSKKFNWEIIESILRTTYEYSHFQRTNLYRDILKWQEENQPYTVLKS
jgi:hypothetical protein